MELRVLKYFLMVAREENISRAAQLLHVTQPTISRQIRELEEELGAKLFERSNHRIVLTRDGQLLRRRAQEILELAERTERDFFHKEADELCGEIAIGSGETRSVSVLAEILSSFRQRYPKVCYRFYSGNADHIKERMEIGALDLGLLPEPADISRYEFVRIPMKEEWGILTQEDSPLGGLQAIRPENLAGRSLMVASREIVVNELANWLGESLPDIFVHYNLLYNVAMLVKNGFGDALCIRLDCAYPGLRFIPLQPPLKFGSVLVWKGHQAASPAAGALIAHAKQCLEGISEDRK